MVERACTDRGKDAGAQKFVFIVFAANANVRPLKSLSMGGALVRWCRSFVVHQTMMMLSLYAL